MGTCKCEDDIYGERIIHNHLRVNYDIGATDTPMGFTPSDMYNFYNFPTGYTGRGRTIAIIDAYDYPYAEEDLRRFSEEFSLPMPRLEIAYPQGRPTETNETWNLEAALDIQWAHTMAPRAKILLVLVPRDTARNLYRAVDYAVKRGVDIISMSWGSRETSSIIQDERYFRDKNVIFVASAGDSGGVTEYPSSSQYVLSVGGTTIHTDGGGDFVNESAWSGSGGGPSRYIPMPIWQRRFGLERLAGRYKATPDVAFDASPYSGVSIYYTDPDTKESSWRVVGGTSLGAPSWAGIIASIFTGYRRTSDVLRELYNLAGRTSYTNPRDCFYDVTTGRAGGYRARVGYDFITGLGTPDIGNISKAIRERWRG